MPFFAIDRYPTKEEIPDWWKTKTGTPTSGQKLYLDNNIKCNRRRTSETKAQAVIVSESGKWGRKAFVASSFSHVGDVI